jgi:hypothetical protein
MIAIEQFLSNIESHIAASGGDPDSELERRLGLARSVIVAVDHVDFFRA